MPAWRSCGSLNYTPSFTRMHSLVSFSGTLCQSTSFALAASFNGVGELLTFSLEVLEMPDCAVLHPRRGHPSAPRLPATTIHIATLSLMGSMRFMPATPMLTVATVSRAPPMYGSRWVCNALVAGVKADKLHQATAMKSHLMQPYCR